MATPDKGTVGADGQPLKVDGLDDTNPNSDFDAAFDEIAQETDQQSTRLKNGTDSDDAVDGTHDGAGGEADKSNTEDHPALSGNDSVAGGSDKSSGTAAAKAAGTSADVWANLSPEQRSALDALNAERTTLDQNLRSAQGRLSAIERERASGGSGTPQGGGKQPAPARKSAMKDLLDSDGFKSFAKEYPEVAAPMKQGLEASDAQMAAIETQLNRASGVTEHLANQETERFYLGKQEELAKRHKDWDKVVDAKAFKEWVPKQPAFVQALVRVNQSRLEDVDAAADVISRFKADTGAAGSSATGTAGAVPPNNQAARRNRQLEGSASTRSSGLGRAPGAPEDFDGAFEYESNRADEEMSNRRRSAGRR